MTDLYRKVEWPEIQDYMNNPDYPKECYFDPDKNCWFIPVEWDPDYLKLEEVKENVFKSLMDDYSVIEDISDAYGEIGDLDDALG